MSPRTADITVKVNVGELATDVLRLLDEAGRAMEELSAAGDNLARFVQPRPDGEGDEPKRALERWRTANRRCHFCGLGGHLEQFGPDYFHIVCHPSQKGAAG